jgi:uncharacterized protein (DUF362 family)
MIHLIGCLSKEGKVNKTEKAIEEVSPLEEATKSKVYVIKTKDRGLGVRELLKHFDLNSLSNKKIAVKANYNSADPFPASTHIDTLSAIIYAFKERNASIVLGERSGMGVTKEVLEEMGVMKLAKRQGFEVNILDDLKNSDWIKEQLEGNRWNRGYLFPKVFREADAIVQTCCLKTHRYGGHFTMSLKNSVGMVAKYNPEDGYNYMAELHSSRYQRQMIAEINAAYKPEVVYC